MATGRTDYLDLALPVQGELSGTWGDTVNNGITKYVDIAIAGTLALATDADVTLTLTEGDAASSNIGSTTSQYMILNCTGSRSTTRNINAPKQSKLYVVINATTGNQSVVLRGGPTSPTTGVTIPNGAQILCAWNGSDFVSVSLSIFSTPLTVVGNSTAGSEIRLPEDTDNGSNYVAVKAPDSIASNLTLTLPDPGSNQTLGYLNIPQNSQSAAYTLVLSDAGKHILHPSADTTARIFTIPANSSVPFPIGTAITFINQNGAGLITIAITTDTMRLSPVGTTGSRILAANGIATCIKLTSTEWIISGTGLS